ncbi:MAG: RNA-binding protein [Holosporaceae bacterium]|jgi:RNA recognition motif-containing protein|nr:RNA-binding protein [Holosporaceae bacterium]
MVKKLHIGNLAYSVTEETLKEAFSPFGTVESVTVIKDKFSGRSKGFGFIEMSTEEEAANALEKLNKTELAGRTIFVAESRSSTGDSFRKNEYSGNKGSFKTNHRSRS